MDSQSLAFVMNLLYELKPYNKNQKDLVETVLECKFSVDLPDAYFDMHDRVYEESIYNNLFICSSETGLMSYFSNKENESILSGPINIYKYNRKLKNEPIETSDFKNNQINNKFDEYINSLYSQTPSQYPSFEAITIPANICNPDSRKLIKKMSETKILSNRRIFIRDILGMDLSAIPTYSQLCFKMIKYIKELEGKNFDELTVFWHIADKSIEENTLYYYWNRIDPHSSQSFYMTYNANVIFKKIKSEFYGREVQIYIKWLNIYAKIFFIYYLLILQFLPVEPDVRFATSLVLYTFVSNINRKTFLEMVNQPIQIISALYCNSYFNKT